MRRCVAASLREFAADLLRHRAASKARAGYVCAPLGNDGRRCLQNALQRGWLALDVDAITPAAFVEWRLFLTRWRGFGWPTASSTPEAPRERVIVELSEPVTRDQGVGIGALLSHDIGDNFGIDVLLDPSTFRAEQPCFLPLVGAVPFYLLGDALAVPTWLERAPPAPPPPPPASAEVALLADARMRHLIGRLQALGLLIAPLANERGFAMHCPWEAQHTGATTASSTAVLFPSAANGWRGGFSCLHTHCRHRTLRTLIDLVARVDAMPPETSNAG